MVSEGRHAGGAGDLEDRGGRRANVEAAPRLRQRRARDAAGAPYGAPGPLTGDGTWTVPLVVRYGDYRAAVGPTGSCLWYGYDARGRLVDSGIFVRSGAQATASITPTMTTFQSLGCTPWFRVQPLN